MLNLELLVIFTASFCAFVKAEDYCQQDCEKFDEVQEIEKCEDAKPNCGMSPFALSMNVILVILSLIGIIAICIRLRLFAKILERRKKRSSKEEEENSF